MELIKKYIHMNREKGKAVTQITLDDDFNLPDTKPDLIRIILEKGEISLDEATITQDHVWLRDMRVVQEMYARGFEFMPIDIYKAKAREFQIVDGKLMPSLGSIEGMGDKAAEGVVDAVKDGPFLSREDFRNRTKVSKTICDLMGDLGILGTMPESNQLSLFDFAV